MAEMQRGVVKWFNDAKGYGFITHETGRDVFVHFSVIEQEGFKTLKDGEEVEYQLREGDKGLNAARVIRLSVPTEGEATATADATAEQTSTQTARPVSEQIEIERAASQDAEQTLITDAVQADRSLSSGAE